MRTSGRSESIRLWFDFCTYLGVNYWGDLIMMHPIYMPFSEEQLGRHFAQVKKGRECVSSAKKHLDYFKASIKNYRNCPERRELRKSLEEMKRPCQVEKDEKFWTAACLMTISNET